MKAIIIALVTCMLVLTGYAYAKPAPIKVSYCKQHPQDCRRAAQWCAKHVGKINACKQSQEVYCAAHQMICRTAH